MVLGELDAILMHLKWDKSFETQLMHIFLKNQSKEDVHRELNRLGDEILKTRQEISRQQWDLF